MQFYFLTSYHDNTSAHEFLFLQGVGHGNPSMSLALAEAAGRYGHVMFPSNLHPPAVQLSQYLLEKGPGKGWASRVFYSGYHNCWIHNIEIHI